jgi:hypothetical protein
LHASARASTRLTPHPRLRLLRLLHLLHLDLLPLDAQCWRVCR